MIVENNKENFAKCICTGCPTYIDCMKEKNQKLFCAVGKTECNPKKQGCICGECPVASQYGLKKLYYCINGAETE
ncbi:MAG: DUF2769 domain-containing protein [Patescibacteria group bacterium]|jgi:hypothetical protein